VRERPKFMHAPMRDFRWLSQRGGRAGEEAVVVDFERRCMCGRIGAREGRERRRRQGGGRIAACKLDIRAGVVCERRRLILVPKTRNRKVPRYGKLT
jgi:hypothetical protein